MKEKDKQFSIEKVRDLIKELLNYNLDAKVFGGDNFGNKLTVTYGGAEGVTRKNCDYVGIHIIGKENTENFC